jgi:hypothetical protein
MMLTVEVHEEDGVLWGQVVELPGCFATGDDLDELTEALGGGYLPLPEQDVDARKAARTAVPGWPDDPRRRLSVLRS